MSDGPVARSRAALARGDVLVAYDEAVTALRADGDDLEARFVVAHLVLSRSSEDRELLRNFTKRQEAFPQVRR